MMLEALEPNKSTPTYSMPENIKPVWHMVKKELLELHAQSDVYFGLYDNANFITLMNSTVPDVFWVIQNSLQHSLSLSFGRLFDKSQTGSFKNVSFCSVIEGIKIIDKDFSNQLLNELKTIEKECANILTWRNKRFGHRDRENAEGKSTSLPQVDRSEIELGLRKLDQLFNRISIRFFAMESNFDLTIDPESPHQLMRYLSKAKSAGH